MLLGLNAVLTRHTLEFPWLLVGALLVLAAVVQVVAQMRDNARLSLFALGLVVLSAAVVIMSLVVETSREQLGRHTRALVASAGPYDAAAFGTLVATDAALLGPDGSSWATLDRVRAGLERLASGTETRHKVLGLAVDDPVWSDDGTGSATVWLDLRTTGSVTSGIPVFTTWELTWRGDEAGVWAATDFRWVRFNQQAPSQGVIP